MNRLLSSFFVLMLSLASLAAQPVGADSPNPSPPVAKKIPKELCLHGCKRVDNYFWFRDKTNPDVLAYLNAENAYADAMTAPQEPLRQTLYQEMVGYMKETDSSAPVHRGDYYYYTRTEKGKEADIYCRKHGSLQAPEEIMLDINALAQGHKFFYVDEVVSSDDNNFLAVTTDTNGYRQYTLQIKDLRSGQWLPEKFERVDAVVWATDNTTLFFVTEDPVNKRWDTLHRHVLGQSKTTTVYFEKDDLFDVDLLARSRDRGFIFLTSESKLSTEVRFIPASQPEANPKVVQAREADHKYFCDSRGDQIYIRTNKKAKNYRIVTAPASKPGKKNWQELVAHDPEVKIEDMNLFASHAALSEWRNGLQVIRIINLTNHESHLIDLPDPDYALGVDVNPQFATPTLRIHYESLVTPHSIFDCDMDSGQRTLVKQTEPPRYQAADYTGERIFATASDGTKIPCSVVYKKGLRRDGSNPLFMYAYGSYGDCSPPEFDYSLLPLLDRGVIYVIAHIRGGGEMGEVWRDEGRMMKKRNTFTDFIACADYLIKEKYTSADRLAVYGLSAGGLLMGAVANMAPDRFRVIIANVPFVDVLTTMLDASIPLTTSEWIEWGNPNLKCDYDYMATYSPVDNVRAQNYPAMLIRVSWNDSQVPYWEGAKFAAKLRATKTDQHLLLLKTNMHAGHGGASGRYDSLRDEAFDYAFILNELGIKQ
jgi:oligopeptidase B